MRIWVKNGLAGIQTLSMMQMSTTHGMLMHGYLEYQICCHQEIQKTRIQFIREAQRQILIFMMMEFIYLK